MSTLLHKLPAFALPFVTRSLRGTRAKRYLVFSAVLAAMTMVIGLWLALGSGEFEHSFRDGVGLEDSAADREFSEFTLFFHSEAQQQSLVRDVANLQRGSEGTRLTDPQRKALWARDFLLKVGLEPAREVEHRALQTEAAQLLPTLDPYPRPDGFDGHENYVWAFASGAFSWDNQAHVHALESIVAARGVPSVTPYSSPLGLIDALQIAAGLAGLALLGLGTVIAPLLVAVQQAQEQHENTLMPLTGTSLSPRQLALGLASGPLAIVAIFAAPHFGLFSLGALVTGRPLIALVFLLVLAAMTALLVVGAQLLGHLVGKRRSPGMVGVVLMGMGFATWMVGLSMLETGDSTRPLAALLPHYGLGGLFGEIWHERPYDGVLLRSAIANAIGALVLGDLTLRALARKIEHKSGALLTMTEAGVGVLVCVVLTHLALPAGLGGTVHAYLGMGILALPMTLLLMSRVPGGDGPARLRKVSLPKLTAELGAWIGVHAFVVSPLFGFETDLLHPAGALAWLAWSVLVLALMTVRLVSVPSSILANLWLAFCGLGLMFGFGQSAFCAFEAGEIVDLFALFNLSPVLGLLQVALTIWIPISLIRYMRGKLAAIR